MLAASAALIVGIDAVAKAAPDGLPQPLIDKLNAAVNEAIRSPSLRERFALIGDEPAGAKID